MKKISGNALSNLTITRDKIELNWNRLLKIAIKTDNSSCFGLTEQESEGVYHEKTQAVIVESNH